MRRRGIVDDRLEGQQTFGWVEDESLMSLSPTVTSLRRGLHRGFAILAGTGVTTPTQWPDKVGDSTGTRTMMRLRSPATAA